MPFNNRIRLPFKLARAQFPEVRNAFTKANGEVKVLSVTVSKTYQGETDWLPEKWHQRLRLAMAHDRIIYEGENYIGEIAGDGDYAIEWQEDLNYPTAKAAFQVRVTPFDATNSNCSTLVELSQVSLEDDTFPAPLDEGGSYNLNLATNDSICCYPALFELVSYNSDYLTAATVDPATGVLSVTLGTGLVEANGLLLATYRVTCPNGGYDEANVFADINGTVEGCLAPLGVAMGSAAPNELFFTWVVPTPAPANGYDWDIRKASAPGVIVQSDTAQVDSEILVTGLEPNTTYIFNVRSNCGDSFSNYITMTGSTTPYTTSCGSYQIGYNNGSGIPSQSANIAVRECDGVVRNHLVYNMQTKIVCADQTAPGTPVQITGPAGTTVTYGGICGEAMCQTFLNEQDAPIFVQYLDCPGNLQTHSLEIGESICAQMVMVGDDNLTITGPC